MTDKIQSKVIKIKKVSAFKGKVFPTVGIILLSIYAVLFLIPLIWALMTSLKSEIDFDYNKFGLPSEWMFSNYAKIFKIIKVAVPTANGAITYYLPALFLNSLLYATGCALMHTLVPCLVAYVTCKYKYKFSKFVYGIVIVTMLLPIVGNLPSQITVTKGLGLFDTYIGIMCMRASFLGINYLIFYGSFKSISWEYAEAGFIDGASHFKVMRSVMLPLVLPTIGAILLLSFITYWNEYYTPMIFLPSMPTVALGVYKFAHSNDNAASVIPFRMAGCILVCIPILIVFMLFKNKLIGNMSMGGIKG